MSWGYKVTILYLSFVALIVFMVIKTFTHKVDLVDVDYYAKELKYQEVIDAKHRMDLIGNCNIEQSTDLLKISLPILFASKKIEGSIYFHSSASEEKDARFKLAIDSLGVQKINKEDLKNGYYKVEIDFMEAGNRYFYEQNYTVTK